MRAGFPAFAALASALIDLTILSNIVNGEFHSAFNLIERLVPVSCIKILCASSHKDTLEVIKPKSVYNFAVLGW